MCIYIYIYIYVVLRHIYIYIHLYIYILLFIVSRLCSIPRQGRRHDGRGLGGASERPRCVFLRLSFEVAPCGGDVLHSDKGEVLLRGGCLLYGLLRMHSQRDSGKLFLFTTNLLMVWQSTPKVVPRSWISRSAAPFPYTFPGFRCLGLGAQCKTTSHLTANVVVHARPARNTGCDTQSHLTAAASTSLRLSLSLSLYIYIYYAIVYYIMLYYMYVYIYIYIV